MDDPILTSNEYLIGFLHKNYSVYQRSQKKKIWFTPLILTLEKWLSLQWEKQLIQHAIVPCRLLTTQQEYVIWRSIIEKSASSFLTAESLATTAQQAWQLCHQWQLDYLTSHFEGSNEFYAWKTWAANLMSFFKEHACIDFSSATTQLIDHFKKRFLIPPRRIFLIGFDDINPQIKKLLQVLEQSGCQITIFTTSCTKKSSARRFVAENTDAELQTMARWAHQRWQAGENSIACVVPSLLEVRQPVINSFTEVFTSLQEQDTPITLPIDVAAGKKLNELPIIQTACNILQLRSVHPCNQISLLLRSPYLAYFEEERAQRCQLDIYLRRYAEHTVDLKQLALISQQQRCPHLSQLVYNLIPLLHENYAKHYPSDWAKHFAIKLQVAGWPGQRCFTSEELQSIERWSELLTELSSLDFILGKISDEMAWKQLQHATANSLLQSKTPQDSPIHLLSLTDTAGLCFKSLWIMGLDDRTWPATAHANPFLPYALQRTHQLPHSSNQREFYIASLITQRLLASTQEIILSHSLQRNEQILRPSTLIASIPCIEKNDLGLPAYQSLISSIWSAQRWEYYTEDYVPVLEEHAPISTSSQLFKQQAACPFQAFARFRLDAHFYSLPQTGLNPIDRGILLHEIIEAFWNALGDQATLLKQTTAELQALIILSIDFGIATFRKKRPFTFQSQFIKIERERLQWQLTKLVDLEKKRPFFGKVTHEKKHYFNIGPLKVRLRIDRIDELRDGSALIIDYKTGTARKFNWFEERLDDPQLPLYCLAYPMAEGFAVIHFGSNSLEIQGFSEKNNGLSHLLSSTSTANLPKTWTALLTHWENGLVMLAKQFHAGFARVEPKHGAATCQLCRLRSFCRINYHE